MLFSSFSSQLPKLFVGSVAKTLIIIALGFKQLAEVWLAVDVVVQRGVVNQTDQKRAEKQ